MKERLAISAAIAFLAALVFVPTARRMAEAAASLPAVSPVSLCYSFDTEAKRTRFVKHTAALASGVFGGLTLAALSTSSWIRNRKKRNSEAGRGE